MKQDRKYLGMTIQQLGLLAGMAVVACLLIGLVGILALRGTWNGAFSRVRESTPTVQFTATPFDLPTITPTETATPVPYEQLIPAGWNQHKTTLVELWLPADFQSAGSGAISGIAGNSVVVELVLVSSTKSSPFKTTVSVAYEPLTASSLDEFVDLRLANIPDGMNMAERHKVSLNATDGYRLMFESKNNNLSIDDLLFVFLDGGTVWYVKYSAEITDFYEMLPIFEQSIQTFRMVR